MVVNGETVDNSNLVEQSNWEIKNNKEQNSTVHKDLRYRYRAGKHVTH